MRLRATRGRGFTLIEVLIAVTILAGLTILAWASINQIFITQDVVQDRQERYRMVRLGMTRMATELSMAYLAGPDHGGEIIPGEESLFDDDDEYRERAFRNRDPLQFGMIGTSDQVDFTAFANVRILEDERASYHSQIGYFTERATDESGRMVMRLMRRSSPNFDGDLDRGGVVYTMIPEIESIRFDYWDPGDTEFGTDREIAQGRWVSEWDTTNRRFAGRMPPRIRITLEMPARGPRGMPEVFVTQTTIGITEVLEY